MPAFPDQEARELSSFCLGWAKVGDTKDGERPLPELCPSLTQLGKHSVRPAPRGGLWAGLGQVPCQIPVKRVKVFH